MATIVAAAGMTRDEAVGGRTIVLSRFSFAWVKRLLIDDDVEVLVAIVVCLLDG